MSERFNEKDSVKIVFSNPTGEKLMDYWFQQFVLEQGYYVGDSQLEMAFRAGQRQAFLQIYNLYNEADK